MDEEVRSELQEAFEKGFFLGIAWIVRFLLWPLFPWNYVRHANVAHFTTTWFQVFGENEWVLQLRSDQQFTLDRQWEILRAEQVAPNDWTYLLLNEVPVETFYRVDSPVHVRLTARKAFSGVEAIYGLSPILTWFIRFTVIPAIVAIGWWLANYVL